MTRTMKAAVVPELGRPLEIREVPVPEVGPGQVLVRVAASGVCHTDLHAAEGDWPVKPTAPFIPGHEGVGHVAAVGAATTDPVATVQRETGGAHGVLVTAVSPKAFGQAIGMVRRKGTVALVGLPPGDFPAPIFDIVLKRITVRGSIVGTRMDLAEALAFAGEGKVASHFSWARLEEINTVFDRMRQGKIDGRVVLDLR